MKPDRRERNGQIVLAFGRHVPNLGRLADLRQEILQVLDSRAWRSYRDGTGDSSWLPGEFDYFLAVWGVAADDVSRLALTDDQKAALVAASDRRRTGTRQYRRTVEEAAMANPHAALADHWQRYGWADKAPVGIRTLTRLQSGATWEKNARVRRAARLRAAGSWARVEAALRATTGLSNDEVRAVIDALRDRLRKAPPGRPMPEDHAAWRRMAEQCDWSPTKCATKWKIDVGAAKMRLARLRAAG
jgi:hypothetical protein